jgi:hypothetical protein
LLLFLKSAVGNLSVATVFAPGRFFSYLRSRGGKFSLHRWLVSGWPFRAEQIQAGRVGHTLKTGFFLEYLISNFHHQKL